MFIQGTTFGTCHREDKRRFVRVLLNGSEFRQIQRSETEIEMEVELFDITGLAIPQPSKLLGIAKHEFNLKAQAVQLVNFECRLFRSGRKQDGITGLVEFAAIQEIRQAHFALEGDVPNNFGIQVNAGLNLADPVQAIGVVQVQFTVVQAGSAPSLLRVFKHKAQVGIAAEFADDC